MAAGGYQKPGAPAPVSGPGALSRRTDGGPAGKQPVRELPDAQYGEALEYRTLQQQAPLAKAGPTVPGGTAPSVGPALPAALNAPTGLPDQPVTHGADAGLGPGLDSLALPSSTGVAYANAHQLITSLTEADPTNPALAALAAQLKTVY